MTVAVTGFDRYHAANAQEMADQLIRCGVKAILNYTPVTLKVPEDVRLANIDPVLGLQTFAYYL